MARQIFSNPGKFQRFGKSRHCCGLTGWTEQSLPSRKMQSPFGLSASARPRRSGRSRMRCWMKSYSLTPLNAARRASSASVMRAHPGQRQHAVHRWHSWKIGMRQIAALPVQRQASVLPAERPGNSRGNCGKTKDGIVRIAATDQDLQVLPCVAAPGGKQLVVTSRPLFLSF